MAVKYDESSIKIGTCIYTGILTDTGSFRHSNTTSSTHRVVSHLLNYNINHTKIHSALFDNKPFSKHSLITLKEYFVCTHSIAPKHSSSSS